MSGKQDLADFIQFGVSGAISASDSGQITSNWDAMRKTSAVDLGCGGGAQAQISSGAAEGPVDGVQTPSATFVRSIRLISKVIFRHAERGALAPLALLLITTASCQVLPKSGIDPIVGVPSKRV